MNVQNIVKNQKKFLEELKRKDIQYRIEKLMALKNVIKENEDEIAKALYKDLNKDKVESYMVEMGMVLSELSYIIKNTKKWAKPKRAATPLSQFLASSFIVPEPYGVVLVMSPWNYPFLLTMQPVIGALAAGNTCIIKPSRFSINTSKIIKKLIEKVYDEKYVSVVWGEDISEELLKQDVDYICYTGSPRVGKIVMKAAAEKLIPVTLELGGKSPCIVEKTADIKLAARRIAFGRILNSGQTCIAPDYILVEKEIKEQFVEELKKNIIKMVGETPLENKEYPKLIGEKQFNKVKEMLVEKEIIYGGKYDEKTLRIEPTILKCTYKSKAMEEEIFGPLFPIIEFTKIDEVIKYITSNPKPLALYLFTNNKKLQKRVLREVSFGGGCINDTIMHIASHNMPFGGVGNSGMGSYHGKYSFDTFSHYKSILKKSNLLDMPMRYHPYKESNYKLIKWFLK
mgnify:CR=1 FL=1